MVAFVQTEYEVMKTGMFEIAVPELSREEHRWTYQSRQTRSPTANALAHTGVRPSFHNVMCKQTL